MDARSQPADTLITRFVGRATELGTFVTAIEQDPKTAARIINIHGVVGSGKTRFADEALQALRKIGRPCATVWPKVALDRGAAGLIRALGNELQYGAAALSATATRVAAAGLDDAAARSVLNAVFQEHYGCNAERRNTVRPKYQRIAFVFDDFDLMPVEVARWVGEALLPALHEVRGHLDYVLILVTEESLAGVVDPVAWNALPARFVSIEVPPLSEAETVELLACYARRPSEAHVCHQLGEGLPGPMIELLKQRLRSPEEIAAALDRIDGLDAEILAAIATVGFLNDEGLRFVLGPERVAAVGPWPQRPLPVPIFGALRGAGAWLPSAVAKLVVARVVPRVPAATQRAQHAAELLEALAVHFPTETARRQAARFDGLRYFNRAVLDECFGKDAALLEEFARSHGGAFETTAADNWRMRVDVARAVGEYVESAGNLSSADVRSAAARLWTARSQDLQHAVETGEKAVAQLEKDRDNVFKELAAARDALVAAEGARQKSKVVRIDENTVRVGVTLLANAAGVACFWIALFSSAQRASFVVLGAILVCAGFFTPALARPAKAASSARYDPEAADRRAVEQARGNVALLEGRNESVQARLTEERRRLQKAKAALDEPYVG